jgi:hypothetical protein
MIYLEAFVLVLSTFFVRTAAHGADENIRYMPFGDSITESVCWRAKLWEKLQRTEYASVKFVGSSTDDYECKDARYDRANEGHSGFLAIDIANKNQLEGWLKRNPADVITMHLGTNDIVHNIATMDIIAAFTKLVATMRMSNSRIKLVVRPLACPSCLFPSLTWYRLHKSSQSALEITTQESSNSTPPSFLGPKSSIGLRARSGSWISIRDSARAT